MKNPVQLLAMILLLLVVTDTKSIFKSNVKPQRKDEFEGDNDSNEYIPSLSPCGSCECSEFCPYCPRSDCTSSCIAIKAAQEARAAAAAQKIAAAQASRQVVVQLAEEAIEASKAAEAALAGKLLHVNQLEHEVKEAQAVIMEEAASSQRTYRNLLTSMSASSEAGFVLKALLCAVRICQKMLCYAQEAAHRTKEELIEKLALLEATKCRLDDLMRELCVAREDLTVICQAVVRARTAAKYACCGAEGCGSNDLQNEQLDRLLNKILYSGREVKQLIQKLLKEYP